MLHARRVDPALPLAMPWRVPGIEPSVDPAARRAAIVRRRRHPLRAACTTSCPAGRGPTRGTCPMPPSAACGETAARLGRRAARLRPSRGPADDAVGRPARRPDAGRSSGRSATGAIGTSSSACSTASTRSSLPAWPSFRAQVVHGDLTTDNALLDEAGLITRHRRLRRHEPLARCSPTWRSRARLAAQRARLDDELFRAARLVLDGYQRVTPLEPLELRLPRRAPRGAGRGDDRDLVVAVRARPRGPGVRRALQRAGRAARSRRCWRSAGTRSPGGSAAARPAPRTAAALVARRERRRSGRRWSRSPTTSPSTWPAPAASG